MKTGRDKSQAGSPWHIQTH